VGWLSPSLEGFLKVAELGSVSRAAESLHLTQPAVTKQIRSLERSMGLALVERTGRGVRLTDAGALVARSGRMGMRALDECRQALEDLGSGARGTLTLGAGVTTCVFQLPAWLRIFRRDRPGVEIIVHTGSSRTVTQQVLDRDVDIGFVTSQASHRELKTQVLYKEEIVLVVAPEFRPARPLSLQSIPLILFPATTGFRRYLDDALGSERLAQQVRMETDSVEAIKSFVMVGLGGAFLPITAVAQELSRHHLKRLAPPRLPMLQRSTTVLRRRDRHLCAAARHFLRILGADDSRDALRG
jgi:DNA-binding transcriptional LysR family regulator